MSEDGPWFVTGRAYYRQVIGRIWWGEFYGCCEAPDEFVRLAGGYYYWRKT